MVSEGGLGLSSRLLARCRAADSFTCVQSVLSSPHKHTLPVCLLFVASTLEFVFSGVGRGT